CRQAHRLSGQWRPLSLRRSEGGSAQSRRGSRLRNRRGRHRRARRRRKEGGEEVRTRILAAVLSLGVLAALAWGAIRLVRTMAAPSSSELPTTRVKRGRVVISVSARGQL